MPKLGRYVWIQLAIFAISIPTMVFFGLRDKYPDFHGYSDIAQRKDAFITFLCPLVTQANESAREHRDVVIQAHRAYQNTGTVDEQLYALGEKYGLTLSVDPELLVERLLRRIGHLPDALVIAQAAIESGWGTSELYAQTYNLFGRRCFYASGCFADNSSGTKYRTFTSPGESVAQYFRDLNTLMPYKPLRDLRAAKVSDGHRLAEGLTAYSSRGTAYVRQVQHIIEENSLANTCAKRPPSA